MCGDRRWGRRHRPAIGCAMTWEAWGPHPGCAEFMTRPDVWGCDAPATHVVKWAATDADGPYQARMCAGHAAEVTSGDAEPGARAYRFRRLPT